MRTRRCFSTRCWPGSPCEADGRYCDATFGRGGHTAAILARLGPAGGVCAIDRDPDAIAAGRERFAAEPRLTLVRGSFGRLEAAVRAAGWEGELQGVLLDLGVSSPQLDEATRGFSFMQDGPLDMRMDNESGMSAAQWLARAPASGRSRTCSSSSAKKDSRGASRAPSSLRALERRSSPRGSSPTSSPAQCRRANRGKHPATRTFQAIRIHVNGELEEARGRAAPGRRPARAGRPPRA